MCEKADSAPIVLSGHGLPESMEGVETPLKARKSNKTGNMLRVQEVQSHGRVPGDLHTFHRQDSPVESCRRRLRFKVAIVKILCSEIVAGARAQVPDPGGHGRLGMLPLDQKLRILSRQSIIRKAVFGCPLPGPLRIVQPPGLQQVTQKRPRGTPVVSALPA